MIPSGYTNHPVPTSLTTFDSFVTGLSSFSWLVDPLAELELESKVKVLLSVLCKYIAFTLIGHVGICREDGVVLDFSGSYLVNVDDFAFGPVARYLQLDRRQVLFLRFII